MPLWLERYVLPICAAMVFGALILNPFKLDWQQRISAFICVSAFAYFVAHTIHKPKTIASATAQFDPRVDTLQQQLDGLKSQQTEILAQKAELDKEKKRREEIRTKLGEFLSEGRSLMSDCLRKPQVAGFSCQDAANKWYNQTAGYIKKNLEPSYAARFINASGNSLSFGGADPATNEALNAVNFRLVALEQFIKELLN